MVDFKKDFFHTYQANYNCFSEIAWELQTAVLEPMEATDGLLPGSVQRILWRSRNALMEL
jgi:hypothetical protein